MYNKNSEGNKLPAYTDFVNFSKTKQAHHNPDYIRDKAKKVYAQDPHRRKYAVPKREDYAPHAKPYITKNYSMTRTREDELNCDITPVKNDQNLLLKTLDCPLGLTLTLKKGDDEGNNYECYDTKHYNTLTLKKNAGRRNTISDINHKRTVSKRKQSKDFNIYNKEGLKKFKANAKKLFGKSYAQKLTKSNNKV